ncbi:MAG: aldehyde dehydrogenase family protein [Candidatus Marinimicrobia bacterium]|jgi:betaine-aldehyde dehydrogenase|nr:aldehyde dehydrogenase family protein [Candidatus Neomarinimicrobiota bacterium]|tara:strand:+ start:2971 stop:4452 length:1482 start_codon:yes stop_codon:yes gene_type:complete
MNNKNYINKSWHDANDGSTFKVENPFTEEIITEVPNSSASDVDVAVSAAKAAWKDWKMLGSLDMRDLLREVAVKSRDNDKEIASIITAESGKPLIECLDEIEWIASIFEYYSEIGRDQRGRVVAPVTPRSMSMVVKESYGVVGCIVPWNYPLLLMAWKVAPALAAGNTVVIKPSEVTPLSILRWIEIACDHLPIGIINVITGNGKTGASLVNHPDVRVIAFTGSIDTGKKIAMMAAKQLKKTSLELGGNDPIIICDDVDINIAAKGTAWGGLLNAGQVCTSLERVFVMESIADSFIEAVVEETKKVRLGDPMNGQTDMGPMCSMMQLRKAEEKVKTAIDQGARLLCGGLRPAEFEKGYFYSPTVFDNMTSNMEMMNLETFGPIIPIQKIKSLEEAIELSNNSMYGLGCNIYTNDMEKALTAADDIKAGSFWINDPLTDNEAAPFGGMKMSGGGRELGIEGLDEFREPKHILIDYQIREKDYWFPYDLDEGRKT